MKKSINILQRVLVNYFYQVNSGFFLFVFFVLFGLPYSPVSFHLSLINGIIQSPVFLALVMLAWLLYNYKCIDYVLKQLWHPRQAFLFSLNSLPPKKVYLTMLYVQILVYMPVLLYAAAIVWLAFKSHQYACAIEVILFNLVVALSTPLLYIAGLQKRTLFNAGGSMPGIKFSFPKPLFLMPMYFLWNDRKQMLFVTKIFSLLLLYGFIKLYEPEGYDIRPLQLCLLLVAVAHSGIVYETRLFEAEYLSFSKNLPITIAGRFLRTMLMYTILLLPELIFLFKGFPIHFAMRDYPQLLLMLLSLLCLFHTTLLLENTTMDQMIRVVFGIIAACFFILLYNPGIALPAFILALSFTLFNACYYHYEKNYGS